MHLLYSQAGHERANEDVAAVRPHPEDSRVLLFSLADGQGGQAGGAATARIAVQESLDAASSFAINELLEPMTWCGVVSAADEDVDADDEAGFATLITLCVTEREVYGASCGDSRALLIAGGRDVWLTEDQHKNPPVGSSAARPMAFSAPLVPSWKLLVMSDGVWNYLGLDGVARLAQQQQGKELIAALRQAVLESNGGKLPDDFTVALVQRSAP